MREKVRVGWTLSDDVIALETAVSFRGGKPETVAIGVQLDRYSQGNFAVRRPAIKPFTSLEVVAHSREVIVNGFGVNVIAHKSRYRSSPDAVVLVGISGNHPRRVYDENRA